MFEETLTVLDLFVLICLPLACKDIRAARFWHSSSQLAKYRAC